MKEVKWEAWMVWSWGKREKSGVSGEITGKSWHVSIHSLYVFMHLIVLNFCGGETDTNNRIERIDNY
jgi:hypothetical protein